MGLIEFPFSAAAEQEIVPNALRHKAQIEGGNQQGEGPTCFATTCFFSVRGKECEKISFSNEFRMKMLWCDTVLAESAEIHSTCIRPRGVFVGSMFNMVARAHMYTAQCNAAAVQQPEGWRIVDPPPCLGGSTHRWVPVAVGSPCDQTAQQYSAETHQTQQDEGCQCETSVVWA